MGSLSEQQLAKLSAALTMPLPETGHQLVTLRLDDQSKLDVRKGLLAMASTVLSEALQLDPECIELKVEGTADIWQRLMALALNTRHQQLQPSDVEALLPTAHKYNMQGVLELLASCVRGFTFTIYPNHPLYVMKWLRLARKLQVSWIADLCTTYILSQMGEAIVLRCKHNNGLAFILEFMNLFSRDNAANIDAPPENVATLTAAYEALRHLM